MKKLASLNKYFLRYKWYLLLGIVFVTVSSLFATAPAVVIQQTIDKVMLQIKPWSGTGSLPVPDTIRAAVFKMVFLNGLLLLGMAALRGFFMFLMRQTIIVMSRHIEYDQKNEIYAHYQQLDTQFFKSHFTGDLMNRISEDVSRVRMFTGPSIMYFSSMVVLTITCIYSMLRVNTTLTMAVVVPLPLLAFSIYYVNKVIFRKSSQIQAQLSSLTSTAQESYSGIRVIKSFVQEANMINFFEEHSQDYRKSAINLSLTEAIYFPAINLFVGLSMISTVLIGGYFAIHGYISIGNIAEFVIYINLLMFPISSLGMVASMTQRAGASQQRIDEFLSTESKITNEPGAADLNLKGKIDIHEVNFTYPHTGIVALTHFNLHIKAGQKVALIGKTGSGKSTIAHLLLRMYDASSGSITIDDVALKGHTLNSLRKQIAYAPQDAYLFSDTVYNNIRFGVENATNEEVIEAARLADLDKDIVGLQKGYETMIGERGVMLSGGQKQRMIIARALLKRSPILILDDCLSAVDTQTERNILNNLQHYLVGVTTIVITHRIFSSWNFDNIIIMDNGHIAEQGKHEDLMQLNGRYARQFRHQTEMSRVE
jgi:ATP-binding cassette subfamily B protein